MTQLRHLRTRRNAAGFEVPVGRILRAGHFVPKNPGRAFAASVRCRQNSVLTCDAAQRETSDGQHDQHEHPAPSGDTA
jgi:hypothetical protein